MPQTATATTTPFDAILVQSRDLLREQLAASVTAMFDNAETALNELAEKEKDEEAQKRYLDARDLAASNREVIESQFRQRLTSAPTRRRRSA